MVQGRGTGVSGKEGWPREGKRDIRSSVRIEAQNKDSGSRVKERDGWLKPGRVCPPPAMAECLDGSSLKRKPKGFNQGTDSPKSGL